MDKNKAAKLREIGYKVDPCCAFCRYAHFVVSNDWATCHLHGYRHLKHDRSDRRLSVHRAGCCSQFEPSIKKISSSLQTYGVFFVENNKN